MSHYSIDFYNCDKTGKQEEQDFFHIHFLHLFQRFIFLNA